MRVFIICAVLFISSISSCKAADFSCQLKEDAKSLKFYCEDFKGVIPESCSIEEISVESSEVKELKIGGCNGDAILQTIHRFPNVRSIDISYSGHESLDWLDFDVELLEKFNASHNNISKIRDGLFNNMSDLIELDLSHNKIRSFDYYASMKLTSLKYVDFSNNLIWRFHHLFPNHKNLEIRMENCPVEQVTCPHFKNNLVHTTLKDIKAFQTDCNGVEFRGVSSEKDAVFSISKSNRIYEFHCSEQSLDEVTFVSLGWNDGFDLINCLGSSVKWLRLANYPDGKLNSNVINRFSNLEWLNLDNTSLSEFDFSVIAKLKGLTISKNNLTNWNRMLLLMLLENLTSLSLSENQLDNVAEVIEHLSPSIEEFGLFGQRIGQPNATAFGKLKHIQRLKLHNVSLIISDSNPFEELEKLSSLDISHNDQKNIDFAVLSTTLSKLTELFVVNCQIQNISRVIQHLGASIERLHLSENPIGHLNADTFKTLPNLEWIILRNASISSIDIDTFKHQSKLSTLQVSNNNLKEFDFQLMPTSLKYFQVDGNDLTEISNFNQQSSSHVDIIDMAQNQFSCDYLAKLMKDWPTLTYYSNPIIQKHGEDCSSKSEAV